MRHESLHTVCCDVQVARVDLCRYRKSADWVMALHAPNAAGDTPLHTSMALPDIPEVTEIIQAFVAVGADISRPNSDGKSALDLAEVRPLTPLSIRHFLDNFQASSGFKSWCFNSGKSP